MAKPDHESFVYMMASRTRVLYCGVTTSLRRRVAEHQDGTYEGFSKQYRCHRLVWFEQFESLVNAIDREKQIKRWRRGKKIWLVEKMNPSWSDLSENW